MPLLVLADTIVPSFQCQAHEWDNIPLTLTLAFAPLNKIIVMEINSFGMHSLFM